MSNAVEEHRERAALGRVPADDDAVAVGEGEHDVVAGTEVADRLRVLGAVPQLAVEVVVDEEHRLGHRDVDDLPGARRVALVEGGEDGDRQLHAGVRVGVAQRVVGVVAAAGVALQLGDPGLGGDDRRVRPPVDPRAGRAVPGDRGVDQAREPRRQLLGAEPEALHHPGAVVLDDDVALGGEREGQLLALRRGQVDADVALAGVLLHEVRRQPVDTRAGVARQVTVRRLELDDLGAEVRQHPRAVRAGEDAREVEDADACEWTSHEPVTVR